LSRPDPSRLAAARAKLDAARARTAKPSRRKRWLLLALLLALLAMLQDCSCNQAPAQPCVQVEATGVGVAEPVPEPPPPDDRRLERRDRPELHPRPPATPPWLAAFRMQVAARSPRLAQCFIGANRPGRLRWTTTVEPAHGAVSEHVVEPTLQGDELTATERACALKALSTPPYRLEGGDTRTTPSRVSLVLEF